ncbi:hypothetical protein [Priestia aryabhattai]|uniref:hypothetical protein n=1 Tax=Priestia aryabhattai TaxID=412384 RepID=UPI0015F398EB|nr:hypothetical protein [Priestia aryabhattai]
MAMIREELDSILNQLPEEKLKLVEEYAKKLIENAEKKKFEDAFNYGIANYDGAFKRLVDK